MDVKLSIKRKFESMNVVDYIGGQIQIVLEARCFSSWTTRYPDTNTAPPHVRELTALPAGYGLEFKPLVSSNKAHTYVFMAS